MNTPQEGKRLVTVENFVRAETDRYMERYAVGPGRKLGAFLFRRDVSPVDDQTIVSQNRARSTAQPSSTSRQGR